MKGYADLESKAVEAFNDTVKSYNDNLIERDIFKSLYQQEHLSMLPSRPLFPTRHRPSYQGLRGSRQRRKGTKSCSSEQI